MQVSFFFQSDYMLFTILCWGGVTLGLKLPIWGNFELSLATHYLLLKAGGGGIDSATNIAPHFFPPPVWKKLNHNLPIFFRLSCKPPSLQDIIIIVLLHTYPKISLKKASRNISIILLYLWNTKICKR